MGPAMRIAVVSDIHGNRTAFDAVLADLRQTSPDLVLHGGDLADTGSSGAYVVDRIRELGWAGVCGNTDEMLFDPESLRAFASRSPQLKPMFDAIEQMAAFTRDALGDERLECLPRVHAAGPVALVHASPATTWRALAAAASDDELRDTYGVLGASVVVYGHIHQAYVRPLAGMTVANSGSVGLPYDGDPRASYLLVDDASVEIRRVGYVVDKEVAAVGQSGMPHAEWVQRILKSAAPQMP
jgi:predicted phosphodiesterase